MSGAALVRQDYRLDGEVLLPYDLKASAAHASMLQKIAVLTAEDRGLTRGHGQQNYKIAG